MSKEIRIQQLENEWKNNPRWEGIERPYTGEDVMKLRGTVDIEYTMAKLGAKKFWHKLKTMDFVAGLGALTGNQAIQEVQAGLEAIYLSG